MVTTLNQDWDAQDKGWVLVHDGCKVTKVAGTETGVSNGIFTTEFKIL